MTAKKNCLSDSCKNFSGPDHEEGFYVGAVTSPPYEVIASQTFGD